MRLHRNLSPKYEKWAQNRIASGQAENLYINDISGTEWPVFGSVFYLWATDSLQDAWVKQHWGNEYLRRENVFYRMLIIGACTSYQNLLNDDQYQYMLRNQVETLARELDESPYGLLDDYPGQCYPTDVIAAIAAIRNADTVLCTDHSHFVVRSLRGFQGRALDKKTALPPYAADSHLGWVGNARGCANAWGLNWAPYLWPDTSKQWYAQSEELFWQKKLGMVGFREFPPSSRVSEWYFDVDSGPVVAGFGVSAGAFGLGAARANGRFDHAWPLSAEVIALSWPLPDGTLLTSRLLSNTTHAPYLGDTGLLFALTRMPPENLTIKTGGRLPLLVYCVLFGFLLMGILLILSTLRSHKRWGRNIKYGSVPFAKFQVTVWAILFITGFIIAVAFHVFFGIVLILTAQFLPQSVKRSRKTEPNTI